MRLMAMWIINGIEPSAGRVRQHEDLSYWMSDEEIASALSTDVRFSSGPWPVTPELVNLLDSRRFLSGLQANFDPDIGILEFVIERKDDWEPLVVTTWADDKAKNPENPVLAARAGGREVIWHLEGFDRVRLFMVEDFELSHRISEDEILTALGSPQAPYYGGLPPTGGLVGLITGRIGLPLYLDEIDYQVNAASRYGHVGRSSTMPEVISPRGSNSGQENSGFSERGS
jgi:hypothetical protein